MSIPGSPAARNSDHTAAFLLLRLFLGLRALLSGVEKFETGGQYSFANYGKTMERIATGITGASFVPLWASKAFSYSLGYVLIILGVAVLLGIKSRYALIALGLVWVGLGFGLMAVQENEGVAWMGVYVGLTAGALLMARYNRFAIWADRY